MSLTRPVADSGSATVDAVRRVDAHRTVEGQHVMKQDHERTSDTARPTSSARPVSRRSVLAGAVLATSAGLVGVNTAWGAGAALAGQGKPDPGEVTDTWPDGTPRVMSYATRASGVAPGVTLVNREFTTGGGELELRTVLDNGTLIGLAKDTGRPDRAVRVRAVGPHNTYWFLGGSDDPYRTGTAQGTTASVGDIVAAGARVALAVDVDQGGARTAELWLASSAGGSASKVRSLPPLLSEGDAAQRDPGSLAIGAGSLWYSEVNYRLDRDQWPTDGRTVELTQWGRGTAVTREYFRYPEVDGSTVYAPLCRLNGSSVSESDRVHSLVPASEGAVLWSWDFLVASTESPLSVQRGAYALDIASDGYVGFWPATHSSVKFSGNTNASPRRVGAVAGKVVALDDDGIWVFDHTGKAVRPGPHAERAVQFAVSSSSPVLAWVARGSTPGRSRVVSVRLS